MQEVWFCLFCFFLPLSFKPFVSADDLHLLFFPMNSSGAKFSDFCSMWKCAIDMIFDNCADVFEILNDGGNILGFFMVYFFLFILSLPVEQSCDGGCKTVLRFAGKKIKFDVSLELLNSSENYMPSFGMFLI